MRCQQLLQQTTCRLVVALLMLLVSGCGTMQGLLATPTPTPANTSTPTLVPTATSTLTPAPTPTLSPWVQDIRSLCLEVEGNWPEILTQAVQDFLAEPEMDLDVVTAGVPCGAVLTVNLTVEALSAQYVNSRWPTPVGYLGFLSQLVCYTGAEATGQMRLALSGRAAAAVSIHNRISPPTTTNVCPEKDRAPFGEAWPSAILDGLTHFWGPRVLVQAATHPRTLSNADPAVVRAAALEALKELSGQDLREDTAVQRWAEEEALRATPFALPLVRPSSTPTNSPTPIPGGITGLALHSDGKPAAGILLGLRKITGPESVYSGEKEVPCIDSSYSAVTDADGRFTIEGILPGKYLVNDATGYGIHAGSTGDCVISAHLAVVDVVPDQMMEVGSIIIK